VPKGFLWVMELQHTFMHPKKIEIKRKSFQSLKSQNPQGDFRCGKVMGTNKEY